ncbi:EPS15 domain-containing protein [Cordyceps fumosorosea ARSEF 2679]|uniref:EPS15 domain-containing protein n=1 Tax=Cordyceps fumosorosea (strain ARSEF 2679) TaxID=1081104 RepID=A0A168B8K4_CORFA|nr:EPS15 domain-containing protein [Cordyceps fumosorosea ARSEF 2679]OAA69770.1 EPS15 domain-containing protein [Cordyceps fumosorosea ARSEF 2679]
MRPGIAFELAPFVSPVTTHHITDNERPAGTETSTDQATRERSSHTTGSHVPASHPLGMNPAVGSRTAGSPDAAAALKGASLAFQKRSPPQQTTSSHRPASSLSSSRHLPPSATTTSDSISRSRSRSRSRSPPLHNQQHSLEHYRENGALLAATSSVERTRSPGRLASSSSPARSSPIRQRPGQHAADVPPEMASDSLPAGLVAERLQQLGASPTRSAAAGASPSAHLALKPLPQPQTPAGAGKLDAKSPSLIAATLAASRSASPTPTTLRKPRRAQGLNTLSDIDAVDSQPIPPTNSLISMFEVDSGAGKDVSPPQPLPTSSPEHAVVRKSARPSPIPIKQTVAAPTPPAPKSVSRQRDRKVQPHEPPPTPPKVADEKPAAAYPRSKPRAVVDATPAPAPTTPASAPKAIVQAAASKPRVTPPKAKEKLKVDGPANTVTPAKVITRAKSTTAMRKLDAIGEVTPPRKRSRKPSPLRLPSNSDEANNGTSTTPRRKSPTPRIISTSTPEVLSPKPTRIARAASLRSGTPPPTIILRPTSDIQSPPLPDPKKRSPAEKRAPTPPKPRNSQRLAPARPASGRPRGNSDTRLTRATPVNSMWGLPIVSSTTSNTPKASKPQPPPSRRESIVSAPPSPTHDPPRRRPTQPSPPSPRQLNSMTNAIMASSLASSRLTPHSTGSSPLPPPPLPMRQRSPHLLQTLRRPQSEPEDDHHQGRQRKAHRHRLHGSKHTHHEGSRRRWRDQVTDKERKRYEALWASNRGLLLHGGAELSDCVADVVVRDIWRRSRLPAEELAEVWELVDRGRAGRLTRQEFVVGMFLIDQRLRGRKLPPKVSDSIWGSVNGVTVLKPPWPKH